MARKTMKVRQGGRAAQTPRAAPVAKSSPSAPDAASLIEKAHILLGQSNFELAIKFLDRALEQEAHNLEARELLGIAELEEGDPDAGREHLRRLFPPHTAEPPSSPSPYLYLAQSAEDAHEALGYYATAAVMLERATAESAMRKGKGKAAGGIEEEEEASEQRKMAVTALVAMIEIWMSDLCHEEVAEHNCDSLIARALSIFPDDLDVRISLASIRMSQQRFDEAKKVIMSLYKEIQGKEPFDTTLPPLQTRLTLVRLLLEHSQHIPALDLLAVAREEDSLEVESAYLEGWAWHLRAEAIEENPSLLDTSREEIGMAGVSASACLEESMRALLECAKLFTDQEYPDDGIGTHLKELLNGLTEKGVKPAEVEDDEADEGDGWEDGQDGEEDVKMA